MTERGEGSRPAGLRRTTLLERTAAAYQAILENPDLAGREERLLRLAEEFFFDPENVARRSMILRRLGYVGSERDLWARGGEKGPLWIALTRIVEWFPKLHESGGTAPFLLWTYLAKDWHRDWKRLTRGSKSHPRVNLEAAEGVIRGEDLAWREQWSEFERRTGLSPIDVDALIERISSRQARGAVHPLRRAMIGMANLPPREGCGRGRQGNVPEALQGQADVFWRRRMLLQARDDVFNEGFGNDPDRDAATSPWENEAKTCEKER